MFELLPYSVRAEFNLNMNGLFYAFGDLIAHKEIIRLETKNGAIAPFFTYVISAFF